MFRKNDYIVILTTHSTTFKENYIFKQRRDQDFLSVEKDCEGDLNGTTLTSFIDSNWRYATKEEIEKYNELNYPFDVTKLINKKEEKGMKKIMLNTLETTYKNLLLRRNTVPLFMSNPGIGKSTIVRQFAEERGVTMKKITLSQRMPNEVVGMMMPDVSTNSMLVFDSHELASLKDGDILFVDEVFNGTLKQTLDAFLNLLEDRILPSGKKLADIMIVAASNPQGLINLTPQIKERFIRIDLKFNDNEYKEYLNYKYGMPYEIGSLICTLIKREKYEIDTWNYASPRSIEKAILQIACGLETTYDEVLMPCLVKTIKSPMDITSLSVKEGDEVQYLEILKLLITNINDKENRKQENRVADNLLS